MDLSIIVPVYNTPQEKLIRCFNSIRRIKEIAYETIIIDDGSRNEIAEFCAQYALLYKEFVYIPQENKGVSAARNVGICNAKGTFIMFVDADDELIPGVLKEISMWQNFDVVFFDFYISEGTNVTKRSIFSPLFTCDLSKKTCIEIAYQNKLNTVWAKLFRRAYIVDKSIKFDESMVSAEDAKFVLESIISAHELKYIPVPAYQYYASSINGNNRLANNPNILPRNAVQLYMLRVESLKKYSTAWDLSNEEERRFYAYAAEVLTRYIFQIRGSLLNMGIDDIYIQAEILPHIRNISLRYIRLFPIQVKVKYVLLTRNCHFLIKMYAYLREMWRKKL